MDLPEKTVLIVEDEESYRKPMADLLRAMGLKVHEAADGQSGYEQALKHQPDLILLDIVMTGYDGLTVMRMLREQEPTKTIPIFLVTNIRPDDEDILALLPASQPAFLLSKVDYNQDEIAERVKEYFETGQVTLKRK